MNLTKEMKDLYTGNYKLLLKEIKEDHIKDILCQWIRRLIIAKITIVPKVIYRFNVILIKIQCPYFLFIFQK